MSAANRNPVSRHPVPLRGIAQVTQASAGEARCVRLGQRTLPVIGHLDTVTLLAPGDEVLVEVLPEGAVVLGRLRGPGEPPAARVQHEADGRLLLEHAGGLRIRAGDACLELTRDGVLHLNGRAIHSIADGLNRLQGATIELN